MIKKLTTVVLVAFVLMLGLYYSVNKLDAYISTNAYCISCHVHTHADELWKVSTHYKTDSGVQINCVDCHLPPKGSVDYWSAKIKAGSMDLYSYYFKDHAKINWGVMSEIENAVRFAPKESCITCHPSLFPFDLSEKGEKAHLYYRRKEDELHCINCHIGVGHGEHKTINERNRSLFKKNDGDSIMQFRRATKVNTFNNFKEQIPSSNVSFEMIAIPAGEFEMSIYSDNKFKRKPIAQKKIRIAPFFMGKIELTWDAYRAFLIDVESEGRNHANESSEADAISGATPPWGDPAQGWGMGQRPAISMTWQAASVYCKWLSQKTGKTYRLPTEAEWKYACGENTIENRIDDELGLRVIYRGNSRGKTQLPEGLKENDFGLINMLGNVKEFCSDWYAGNPFENVVDSLLFNPEGPRKGKEHVIKGGSYRSKKEQVRANYRESTQHDKWQKTDPQMPKSIWWYSDCRDVGFRLVCEWDSED